MSSAWKITLQKTNSVLLHECSLTFTREIFVNCELPKTNTSTHPTTLTHMYRHEHEHIYMNIIKHTAAKKKKYYSRFLSWSWEMKYFYSIHYPFKRPFGNFQIGGGLVQYWCRPPYIYRSSSNENEFFSLKRFVLFTVSRYVVYPWLVVNVSKIQRAAECIWLYIKISLENSFMWRLLMPMMKIIFLWLQEKHCR